jgi:hypothetical protein
MKTLLSIGLWLISLSSIAQFDQLTIYFQPAMIRNSRLTISKIDNGYSMIFQIFHFKEYTTVPDSTLIDLKDFLDNYEFLVKASTDTVWKTLEMEDGDITDYIKLSMDNNEAAVYGKLKAQGKEENFNFW